jgi:hypothetical protein
MEIFNSVSYEEECTFVFGDSSCWVRRHKFSQNIMISVAMCIRKGNSAVMEMTPVSVFVPEM